MRRLANAVAAVAFVTTAMPSAAQAPPPELTTLAARAGIDAAISSWCGAEFRAGERGAFAVAVQGNGGARYLVLGLDSAIVELAPFAGSPDLSCYSRVDAESLSEAIAGSETVEGRITPRFDTTVVCGFVEETRAVCWQYAPTERAFVKVGEWIT